MQKDNIVYIKHILDAINRIESYVDGLDDYEFLDDWHTMTRSATVRDLEIIGEATNKLDPNFRNKYPQIPWRDMIDTRNKVIHDYMMVDYELVWDIVMKDLPNLKSDLEKLLI